MKGAPVPPASLSPSQASAGRRGGARRGPRSPHAGSRATVPAPRLPNKAAVTGSLSRASRTLGRRAPAVLGVWTEAQRTNLLAWGRGRTLESIGKALDSAQECGPKIPFTEPRQRGSAIKGTRCSCEREAVMTILDITDLFSSSSPSRLFLFLRDGLGLNQKSTS